MAKSKSKYILFVVTLGMLCAFAPMCSDLYLSALPDLMRFYHTNASSVQLSLTSTFLGLAIGQLFIGPISDAYGRIKPLVFSLILFTIVSIGCAISPNIQSFIALRFVQGFCGAGGIVLTRSIASDMFRGNRLTSFMAFLMSINSVAPILGPILGSFIISFAPWQAIFYLLAVWGVLLLVCTFSSVKETLPKSKRNGNILKALKSLGAECLNLKFMLCVFSLSFVMGGFFSYIAASPFVFQIIYGLTPFEFSLSFAFIAICISVIAAGTGKLARRLGEIKTIYVAYTLMTITASIVLFMAITDFKLLPLLIICLAIYCAMMGVSQTAGFTLVMASKRGGAGAASGLFGVLTFLFGAITSPLVGLMGEDSMLPLGISLLACALLAALCMKLSLNVKKS